MPKGSLGAFYWSTFLDTNVRANDGPELTINVLDSLLTLSDGDFAEILYPASDWFEHVANGSLFSSAPRCEELWSKFMRATGRCEEAGSSAAIREDIPAGRTRDWSTEAIASPSGNLAELIVKVLPDSLSDARNASAAPWFRKLEELLDLPADSRRYALVIVAQDLDRFFAADPEWTTQHVLSVLDKQPETEPDREAFWAGFFSARRLPSLALFARLTPHLLALTKAGSDPDQCHSESLAKIILAGWRIREAGGRLISDEQIRAAILNADDTIRHWLLWTLRCWSDDKEAWSSARIVEFLSKAWPRQRRVKTAKTSADLFEFAFSQTTGFPEVARIVTELVAKTDDARFVTIPALSNLEEVTAGEHPREVLDLLHAFLPDQRAQWPYSAADALQFLKNQHPSICRDPKFIDLDGRT